jgi:hypothetical protein
VFRFADASVRATSDPMPIRSTADGLELVDRVLRPTDIRGDAATERDV